MKNKTIIKTRLLEILKIVGNLCLKCIGYLFRILVVFILIVLTYIFCIYCIFHPIVYIFTGLKVENIFSKPTIVVITIFEKFDSIFFPEGYIKSVGNRGLFPLNNKIK